MKKLIMKHQRNSLIMARPYSFVSLLAVVCALFTFNVSKAINKIGQVKADSVYLKVDKQPSFTGGNDALIRFLEKNLKYPTEMENRGVQGRVIVQFIVEKDGSLTDVTALKGPGHGSSEEAVRVMKLSPKWQPGYIGKEVVRTQVKMAVPFVIKAVDPRQSTSGIKVINGG
jgi:TonB family protein